MLADRNNRPQPLQARRHDSRTSLSQTPTTGRWALARLDLDQVTELDVSD